MKNLFIPLFSLMIFTAHADEGVCVKCQLVREYNEEHKSPYEFYEDYIKDKEAGLAEEIRFPE